MNNKVEVVTIRESTESLRNEWRELFARSNAVPFLSWEWMSAWAEAYQGDAHVLSLRDGDGLVGLLPLQVKHRIGASGSRRSLEFLGNGRSGADHLDLIAAPADRERCAAAFARFLVGERPDMIVLDDLSPISPLRRALRDTGREQGWNYYERQSYVCPKIDLGRGWKAVLAGSRRASNFKRRLKHLETLPGFQFRSLSLPGDCLPAFGRFLDLHEMRWSNELSELSGRKQLTTFHRQVVERMASTGAVRFDELWVKGDCVASIYGFDDRNTFYYFNSGYDPKWSKQSVGLVLLGLSIRAACDRGRRVYDFLRGEEAYKFDWADGSEVLVKACMINNTLAGRAFAAGEGLRHHARDLSRMLPAGALARVRNWAYSEALASA